jgi:hypothetical protein
LSPFAFPIVILACGVAFAAPPSNAAAAALVFAGQAVLVTLLLAQLPLAVVAIRRSGEQWPAVAASWTFAGYLSLAAGFIGSMAVTGDWL